MRLASTVEPSSPDVAKIGNGESWRKIIGSVDSLVFFPIRYDTSSDKCVRTCNKVENQPQNSGDSQTDCQTYIRCANVGRGRYEPVLHYCSCDEGFDLKNFNCSTEAACLANMKNTCGSSGDGTDDQETDVDSKIAQRSLTEDSIERAEDLVIVKDDNAHGILMNLAEEDPSLVSLLTNAEGTSKKKRSIEDLKNFIDRLIQWLVGLLSRTNQGTR